MTRSSVLILVAVCTVATLATMANSAPDAAGTTKTTTRRPQTTTRRATTTTRRTTSRSRSTTRDTCLGTGSLKCYSCTSYPPHQRSCKTGCIRGETCQLRKQEPYNPQGIKMNIYGASSTRLPSGCTTVKEDYQKVTTCNCNSNFCNSAVIAAPSLLTGATLTTVVVVIAQRLL